MPIAPPENPDRTAWMILTNPPPTPACYESRESWQRYLLSMWESGEKLTKLVDNKRNPDAPKRYEQRFIPINHCTDCQVGGEFQQRMQACGRCKPFDGPQTPESRDAESRRLVAFKVYVHADAKAEYAQRGQNWARKALAEAATQ